MMQELKQVIVNRNSAEKDQGILYDHEYVIIKETFIDFVRRVTQACNCIHGEVLSVSYVDEDTAVILYRLPASKLY